MEVSLWEKIRRRASKRVSWLAIGLSFIFIGALPLPTEEIHMSTL